MVIHKESTAPKKNSGKIPKILPDLNNGYIFARHGVDKAIGAACAAKSPANFELDGVGLRSAPAEQLNMTSLCIS
jgi:hypothetical protein